MGDRRGFLKTASMAVGALPFLSSTLRPASPPPAVKPRRIIIDTDPGVDDALAIMMALRTPELHIEAVTAVAGNVPLALTSTNALKLVSLGGRRDIPVATGASAPLVRKLQVATYAHGENGMVGVELPPPTISFAPEHAVDLISRIVRSNPGEITIVAIGPLTNIALVLRNDPVIAKQIQSIVLMGGGVNKGNITPSAEFNFYVDPEAASIVFGSGIQITMVGLNATERVSFTDVQLRALEQANSPISKAAAEICRRVLDHAAQRGGPREFHIHDALALATLLDPDVVTLEDYYVQIETTGEFTSGESVCYKRMPMRSSAPLLSSSQADPAQEITFPKTRVAVDGNSALFCNLLVDRLAH